VDLILTDPPYGIGEDGSRNHTRGCLAKSRYYPKTGWDTTAPDRAYFDVIRRISKNQVIFGANHFANRLPESSCWIVWDKDNGATDFADCELAWTSFPQAVRLVRWKSQGMLQEPGYPKEYRQHPTQKPLAVMRWILERFGSGCQTIVDPYCGSGTVCVAAKILGRQYIGIDINPDYCKIAEERLRAVETGVPVKEQKAGQMPLFGE
jgi:site-specific DNA-methyltransferase (adenine-specific)